jgi:hypothetical protein
MTCGFWVLGEAFTINTSTIARPAHSSRRTVDITRNRNYLAILAQNIG